MNYIQFHQLFAKQQYVSLAQIRLYEADFRVANLSEWVKQWYITTITKGWYLFTDVMRDEGLSMVIATDIYEPSYISMESGLRYYDLIPEWVFMQTAVSSKKSQLLSWPTGSYKYYHVQPRHYWWYQLIYNRKRNKYLRIAEPEKLLCDWFYLKPYHPSEFEELRITASSYHELVDVAKLRRYAQRFGVVRLINTIEQFITFMEEYD